jgi:outer membrane lipoprotein-sorting protein
MRAELIFLVNMLKTHDLHHALGRATLMAAVSCVAIASAEAYAQGAKTPSAREIVRRADEVRFPQEGFEVSVHIRTSDNGRPTDTRLLKVLSKGNDSTAVLTVEPATERGQILLMKGRDLWVFLPTVSQPVRLSLAQRLVGQVANGDLARANFTGDYVPTLTGTEIEGSERLYVLDLVAADAGVTYQKVRYWVRQGDFRPHRAEFYSQSGRLLKTCRYEEFRVLGGKVRPTRLVMVDALRKGEQSTLEYRDLKLRDLPDRIFTKEYLRRLD